MDQIVFTSRQHAELVTVAELPGAIGASEVRGRTLISLTSPGTELNWQYLGTEFPAYPGYACIFEVRAVGEAVSRIKPGDVVFGAGPHRQFQSMEERDVLLVPKGLAPEQAVFGRLAGVSMSALVQTPARPPARVLITGLGPVGNLAAQVFEACGYRVTAIDPVEARRQDAVRLGIGDVRSDVARIGTDEAGRFALHLECSGHEQAVLDGVKLVAEGAEVVLVGVPWSRRSEVYAFDVLNAIFYRYVTVRSGWEWQVPRYAERFRHNSIDDNLAMAMQWIADGRLDVSDFAELRSPATATAVYRGLLDRSLTRSSVLFDWRD